MCFADRSGGPGGDALLLGNGTTKSCVAGFCGGRPFSRRGANRGSPKLFFGPSMACGVLVGIDAPALDVAIGRPAITGLKGAAAYPSI